MDTTKYITYNTEHGLVTLYRNDIYINHPFQKGQYHDSDTVELLKEYINPNKNILEIGAHCGTSSLLYSNCIGNNSKIYSYEPQKNMFNLLKHNINQNNLENKIIPINKGVFCYTGEGVMNDIDLDGGDFGNISKRYEEEINMTCNFGGVGLGKNGEIINLMTLDEINIDNLGYIHCDAQGAENFIFSKGLKIIEKYRPVILYENKDFYGTYLYDNICNTYPDYHQYKDFDIKRYCMEVLGYSRYIDRFNNGIDTLLIP